MRAKCHVTHVYIVLHTLWCTKAVDAFGFDSDNVITKTCGRHVQTFIIDKKKLLAYNIILEECM